MKRLLLLLLLVPALAGAASRTVMSSEFGTRWPLVPTDGTLSCVKKGAQNVVTFIAPGGKWYALNGIASGAGYPDIDPIWKDDTSNPGAKVSIRPLIDAGLAICD